MKGKTVLTIKQIDRPDDATLADIEARPEAAVVTVKLQYNKQHVLFSYPIKEALAEVVPTIVWPCILEEAISTYLAQIQETIYRQRIHPHTYLANEVYLHVSWTGIDDYMATLNAELEEFRSKRQDVDPTENDYDFDLRDDCVTVLEYPDQWIIEKLADGRYHLMLERLEWIKDVSELAELEQRLYWAYRPHNFASSFYMVD